jgi:hypothetical protein
MNDWINRDHTCKVGNFGIRNVGYNPHDFRNPAILGCTGNKHIISSIDSEVELCEVMLYMPPAVAYCLMKMRN